MLFYRLMVVGNLSWPVCWLRGAAHCEAGRCRETRCNWKKKMKANYREVKHSSADRQWISELCLCGACHQRRSELLKLVGVSWSQLYATNQIPFKLPPTCPPESLHLKYRGEMFPQQHSQRCSYWSLFELESWVFKGQVVVVVVYSSILLTIEPVVLVLLLFFKFISRIVKQSLFCLYNTDGTIRKNTHIVFYKICFHSHIVIIYLLIDPRGK